MGMTNEDGVKISDGAVHSWNSFASKEIQKNSFGRIIILNRIQIKKKSFISKEQRHRKVSL